MIADQGADSLNGGTSRDLVHRGAGDDRIVLISGCGGSGADRFLPHPTQSRLHANMDFETGVDSLAIARVLLPLAPPDLPALLLGDPTSLAPHVVWRHNPFAATTTRSWDADGAGSAAALHLVTFDGQITLTMADLTLL